ncbi:MAG: hypothetical protein ACQEVA_17570 [Myxococcota bacterium]
MSEDTKDKVDDPSRRQDVWRPLDAFKRPFDLDLPLLLVPFAVVAGVMGLVPLRNWDYWWHLSVGRVIDVYGAVPDKNHYLYTVSEDAASFIQPWLSDWLMLSIHDAGGLYVGLTARNLLAAVAFALVGAVASRRANNPVLGSLLAILGFLVGATTLFAGPTVFATLLFSIVVAVGYGVRERFLPRITLVAFPIVTVLWANMDAAFLLPAALSFAFLLGSFLGGTGDESFDTDYRAAWALTLGLCVIAPVLNPRGFEIYGYLTHVIFDLSLRRLVFYGLSIGDYAGQLPSIAFFAGLVLIFVLTPRDYKRLDRTDFCVIILSLLGSYWNARLLPFFGIILTASLARHTAATLPDFAWPKLSGSRFKAVLAAVLLLVVAFGMQRLTNTQDDFINAIQPFEARQEQPLKGLVPPETPVIHAEILDGLAVVPRLYHDRRYAGFLIFQLVDGKPDPIVFVDPRVDLPPADIWKLYHMINDGEAWRGTFQQFGVNSAVLNKQTQAPLIEDMRTRREWQVAYDDDHNVLFVLE